MQNSCDKEGWFFGNRFVVTDVWVILWCCHWSFGLIIECNLIVFCLWNILLTQNASTWFMEDLYRNPGPIQLEGAGSNSITEGFNSIQ
jgi:hypothetical protein